MVMSSLRRIFFSKEMYDGYLGLRLLGTGNLPSGHYPKDTVLFVDMQLIQERDYF